MPLIDLFEHHVPVQFFVASHGHLLPGRPRRGAADAEAQADRTGGTDRRLTMRAVAEVGRHIEAGGLLQRVDEPFDLCRLRSGVRFRAGDMFYGLTQRSNRADGGQTL